MEDFCDICGYLAEVREETEPDGVKIKICKVCDEFFEVLKREKINESTNN